MRQKFGERAAMNGLRRRDLGLLFTAAVVGGAALAALVLALT